MSILQRDTLTAKSLIKDFLESSNQIYIAVSLDDWDMETDEGEDHRTHLEEHSNPSQKDLADSYSIESKHAYKMHGVGEVLVCNNKDLIHEYEMDDFNSNARSQFVSYTTFIEVLKQFPTLNLVISNQDIPKIILQKKSS